MKLANPFRLINSGILGMNRRNVDFVHRYNKRHLYPFVDDKLKTKLLAESAGITVPKLYGVVRIQHQIRELPALLKEYDEFVVKPSMGSEGKGILVITGKKDKSFIRANGTRVSLTEINRHTTNILSGLYSLGGQRDKALIEYMVHFDPIFKGISYQGVPDIRVLVFIGYPVMAMLRLPTSQSNGKANLHQGAVGVGIDVGAGYTLSGVCKGKSVTRHPDTGTTFANLTIPNWGNLLRLAAGCYDMTGLGYLGIDIVLDKDLGPMILELNARPGLSIQIANNAGLLTRLSRIEQIANDRCDMEDRVEFSRQQFSTVFVNAKNVPKYFL